MTDTPNRSDAFKIRPVDTCSWLDREPTDPTSYLDSIAAQGWAPTGIGSETAARVPLQARRPLSRPAPHPGHERGEPRRASAGHG